MNILKEIENRKSVSVFKDNNVEDEKIDALIEAARWAPSSFNNQPWNYVFLSKTDSGRNGVEKALTSTNGWAKKAPLLVVAFARKKDDSVYDEREYYLYDTGQSVMSLVLEAEHQGLRSHQMAGFKGEKVKEALNIGEDYVPIVIIAIGYEEKNKKFLEKVGDKLKEKVLRSRKRKDKEKNFFRGKIK